MRSNVFVCFVVVVVVVVVVCDEHTDGRTNNVVIPVPSLTKNKQDDVGGQTDRQTINNRRTDVQRKIL